MLRTLARARSYVTRPDVRRDLIRLASRRMLYEIERHIAPRRLASLRTFTIHDGLVVTGRLSDVISRSLYLYGTFEFASTEVFRQLIRAGDVVVDAGAHLGTYSLIASRGVGPHGRVLAFEPDPRNVALLRTNVHANRALNVSIHEVALFERTTMLPLESPAHEENSGLPRLVRDGRTDVRSPVVTCRPLDEMLEELGVPTVNVMKVDVEGSEEQVFRGAAAALESFRPDILFEVGALEDTSHGATNPAIEILRSCGYRVFGIRQLDGVPRLEAIPPSTPAHEYFAAFREPWQQLNLVARHPGSRPAS